MKAKGIAAIALGEGWEEQRNQKVGQNKEHERKPNWFKHIITHSQLLEHLS